MTDDANIREVKPSDCVLLLNDSRLGGKGTIYHVDLLGEEANGLFGRCNELMYRKDPGWEDEFRILAAEFEKLTGFSPERIFEAQENLRRLEGLLPLVDRQRESFFVSLTSLESKER